MKKKILRKIICLVSILTLSLSVLTGCGTTGDEESQSDSETQSTGSNEEIVIRVADFTGGGCVWNDQFIVAYQKGFYDEIFRDDNVKIEVTQFASGPAVNEAFIAGDVDVVNGIGDQPLVIGIGNNVESTILTQTSSQGGNVGVVAKSDSGIQSVEDLKGKRISVSVGTYIHKSLLGVLDDAGLSEDDVELVNISSASDVDAAFETGDIDAAVCTAYQLITKTESGEFVQVADFANHPLFAYIVAADSFVGQYPDYTEKFIEGLHQAEEWINANKEEAYEVIAEYADMDVEQVRLTIQDANCTIRYNENSRNNLSVTYDFLKSHDLITTTLTDEDIDNHIDTSFLDKVLSN